VLLKRHCHEIFNIWFFFINQTPLGPWFMPWNIFEFRFKFVEIFDRKIYNNLLCSIADNQNLTCSKSILRVLFFRPHVGIYVHLWMIFLLDIKYKLKGPCHEILNLWFFFNNQPFAQLSLQSCNELWFYYWPI
jgi:hypothetical protein